jgi:EAL and modified HD-GYP domain-containing signal transduction protein
MAEHLSLAATAPPSAPAPDAEVLFARQPILDADSRLAGYELLYRGEGQESPHAATSRVAASALSDLGLRSATGGAPAFLNVTTEFLLAMDPLPFGPEGVVLEIAADRVPDGALLERLGRLRQHGYMLALAGGRPPAGLHRAGQGRGARRGRRRVDHARRQDPGPRPAPGRQRRRVPHRS